MREETKSEEGISVGNARLQLFENIRVKEYEGRGERDNNEDRGEGEDRYVEQMIMSDG